MATQTAKKIINGALQKIQVKTAGVDLSEDEYSDAISVLNDMMLAFDASGIRLNWTIIVDKDGIVTSPDWAAMMIKSSLAVALAPEYGAQISQALAAQVAESTSIVNNRVIQIVQPSLSNTLPTGSGHGTCNRYNSNFFHNHEANDLLFGNGQKMADDEGVQLDFEGNNNEL